jgi:hypothetical protein
VAAADLVADQPADDAAEDRAAVVAPSAAARLGDPLRAAFLSWHAHVLVARLDVADAGVVEVGLGVGRDRGRGEQGEEGEALHAGLHGLGDGCMVQPAA